MTGESLKQAGKGKSGRHRLSSGGTLAMERGLPFLLVHRAPPGRPDAGTARLIAGEACYLAARSGEAAEARELARRIAAEGADAHGAFVVLEVWSAADPEARRFTLNAPRGPAPETVERLLQALDAIRELLPDLDIALDDSDERHPPDMEPLFDVGESWKGEILLLGLEVPPVYRDAGTGRPFPRFLRRFQRALSRALRQGLYEFIRVQTSAEVGHHLALGRRSLPAAAKQVDRALYAVEHSFDLLLLSSPVNGNEEWHRFRDSGFERNPAFHYRLLPVDPDLLKRELFAVETEVIDDPALADLFHDKRDELDTQLTMLTDRETPAFRFSSQRLYGTVSDDLLEQAAGVLRDVQQPRPRRAGVVGAGAFLDAALRELDYYRQQYPRLDRRADVRPDITGLMVSEGNLLIGSSLQLDSARVEPLLHHEVGTHVLTFVNGSAQPLKQLSLGLAGYDELQEGLAVLSEYLAGGLDALRMRLLAARVIAARSVESGATFVDTFRVLTREHGFTDAGAWDITLRVHQSGGFTRDFIYLRGLIELVETLREGVPLESLYIGKIARKHIQIVEELRHRKILLEPPLRPRFLNDASVLERLEAVRSGIPLTEMVCNANR